MRAGAKRPRAKVGFFRELRVRDDNGTGAAESADAALTPLTGSERSEERVSGLSAVSVVSAAPPSDAPLVRTRGCLSPVVTG